MRKLMSLFCIFFDHRWIRPADEIYDPVICRRCKCVGSDIAFDFSGKYEDEPEKPHWTPAPSQEPKP